nr:peptidoglycan editing factor PgeF [Consotaella salsifontis]
MNDALSGSGRVAHAFFTRLGGVSTGIYRGLNVGFGSKDERASVRENRDRAMAFLGTTLEVATPWQVHSPDVIIVDQPLPAERPKADGVVTSTPGLAVGVVTADCGPVLFSDAEAGVVGAAHSGWRGALSGVLEATIAAMEQRGARRDRIVACLGPTITQANYEVGAEMEAAFAERDADYARFFAPGRSPEKRQFDLPGLVLARIASAGVQASFTGHCTYADERRFFSFRRTTHRQELDYGRQLSAIMLKF